MIDYWDIIRTEIKKYRKKHICSECKKIIKKGSTYTKIDIGCMGYWSNYRFHYKCVSKNKKINKAEKHNKKVDKLYEAINKYPRIKVLIKNLQSIPEKYETNETIKRIRNIINEK